MPSKEKRRSLRFNLRTNLFQRRLCNIQQSQVNDAHYVSFVRIRLRRPERKWKHRRVDDTRSPLSLSLLKSLFPRKRIDHNIPTGWKPVRYQRNVSLISYLNNANAFTVVGWGGQTVNTVTEYGRLSFLEASAKTR